MTIPRRAGMLGVVLAKTVGRWDFEVVLVRD